MYIQDLQDVMLRLKIISANSFARVARTTPVIGIMMAVAGPFLLLTASGRETSNLPWYVWAITLLLLLLVMARGRHMFMLDSREAEAISISPNRR